ncbi:hypothetical protein [Pengzhenrongella phosphoraccumulans]|uniref:hypothetical protein n=1 Tax=Pengzhenrongella phosphoraccumulans TaxID=3114394 RepID=UPI00388EC8F0
MTRRRIARSGIPSRGAARLAIAVLVTGLLTGCAGAPPDLTDDAGARLQADVLEVTRAAAANDLPSARAALETLTTQLSTDRESGAVSPDRGQLIEASIVLVAADLTSLEQAEADAKAAATKAAAAKAAATKAAQDAAAAQKAKDNKNDRGKNKKNGD